MDWKPIETAPVCVVICTDRGFAIFTGRNPDWYLCDSDGNVISCADDGMSVSAISPTKWIALDEIGL